MAEPTAADLRHHGRGAVLREIGVRNVAYPHMVKETLAALFDPAAIADAVRRLLGFDVADVCAVFDALHHLNGQAWSARFDAMRSLRGIHMETATGAVPFTDETRDRGRALWDSIWGRPGDCSTWSDEELAAEAKRPVAVVHAVREAFSTPMAIEPPEHAALRFFEGASAFRTRPLLTDASGDSVVVHGALPIAAVRERLEEALKTDNGAWDTYQAHRAKHLETTALDLLSRNLPGAARHESLEFFVPASDTETTPDAYTQLVETDGLLVVDDVAVVVEGKAGALHRLSRTGHRARLERDLRALVTSAAHQADRMRRRIVDDHGLRLRDGSWLELSGIREVHTVAVTLDDLPGVATVTSQLVHAGLLPGEQLPWSVSVHDLRITSELVDRPSDLLLYLRRRTEPDVTRRFHAVDELDFYLHFLATGLWTEPDPEKTAALLPHLGPPRVRELRRYK